MTTNFHYLLDLMFLSLFLTNSDERVIDCGSHYTRRTGSFSSPGHPNNYSADLYCVWTISVNGMSPEIELTFSHFNLPESSSGKCTDYVAIYFGLKKLPDKLLGEYCGASKPAALVVRGQSARVEFVSNEDSITSSGFELIYNIKVSKNSITSSQATAGIVAAIFCGIVFVGVAAMRCIMLGACQQCQNQQQRNRECVGTDETLSDYVMDCPPSYRTVMEHPESFPTPNITPYPTPTASPRLSRDIEPIDENDEPPPPYSRIVHSNTACRHDGHNNVVSVDTHINPVRNATREGEPTRQEHDDIEDSGFRGNDVEVRL